MRIFGILLLFGSTFMAFEVLAKEYCYVSENELKCIELGADNPDVPRDGAGGGGCGGSSACGGNNREISWMKGYIYSNPKAIQNKNDILNIINKSSTELAPIQLHQK